MAFSWWPSITGRGVFSSAQLGEVYFRSAATKNSGIGVCSQARAQAGLAERKVLSSSLKLHMHSKHNRNTKTVRTGSGMEEAGVQWRRQRIVIENARYKLSSSQWDSHHKFA